MTGRIIEALPPTNDEFYIEYPVSSNAFTLKREDRRWKIAVAKGKKHIFKPKNWSKQYFIFWRKNRHNTF